MYKATITILNTTTGEIKMTYHVDELSNLLIEAHELEDLLDTINDMSYTDKFMISSVKIEEWD